MFNDTYNLSAGTKGRSEWSYRGIVHERAPGEVGLFEPGEVRVDLKYHSPLDYRVLQIEKSCLDSLLDSCGIRRPRKGVEIVGAVRDLAGATVSCYLRGGWLFSASGPSLARTGSYVCLATEVHWPICVSHYWDRNSQIGDALLKPEERELSSFRENFLVPACLICRIFCAMESGGVSSCDPEERRRIARELHNSTGQILAALGMSLTPL